MRCTNAQRLLSLRRDGSLSARQSRAIAAHMAACSVCRTYDETLREIASELKAAYPLLTERGLAQRAVGQWHQEAAASHLPYRLTPWARSGSMAGLIGAGGLALMVLSLSRHAPPVNRSSRHNSQVHLVTMPRVEVANAQITHSIPHAIDAAPQRLWDIRASMQAPVTGKGAEPQTRHGFAVSPGHDLLRMSYSLRDSVSATRRNAGSFSVRAAHADDLAYINADVAATAGRWNRLNVDRVEAQMAQLQQAVHGGDDFVKVPVPSVAGARSGAMQAAMAAYRQQAAIVDARLQHRVTLAVKGMPLSELCRRLSRECAIDIHAGRSVADVEITIFCTQRPLRDLMREITGLFGFSWLRDGEEGHFRYELAQDLRSQLLEEELRNRDRDAALLALDREMERYRKYLPLSPAEARKQVTTAPKADVDLLRALGGVAWAPIHLYFMLSPQEQRALREEPDLRYGEMNTSDQRPLPPELHHHALEALTDVRISTENGGISLTSDAAAPGVSVAEFPESRASLTLQLKRDQLDRYTLSGDVGFMAVSPMGSVGMNQNATLAVGVSAALANLDNAATNAKLAGNPDMRQRITVTTKPSCFPVPDYNHWAPAPRATTADALAALHEVTKQDIIADHYTRLYLAADLSTTEMPLFDTLNQLAGKMHMRWQQTGGWLAFRSATYYYDRLKAVPQRLLARWAEAKRNNGMLAVTDLIEMAGLNDTQLDSEEGAEAAWAIYGLTEWEWVHDRQLRDQWRLLADLSPQQIEALTTSDGISIADLPAAQAQRGIALLLPLANGQSIRWQEFANCTLRVTLPKPEKLRAVPKVESYSPMDYGPVFHYEYGVTGRRKTRKIGLYSTQSTG